MDIYNILNKHEAKSMGFLPQVVWDKAYGNTIIDLTGKEYIDFSSGVMIANTGHGNEQIKKAIINHLEISGMLTSYMFPTVAKAEFLQNFANYIPNGYKVALFSTGSESADATIKLARLWGIKNKPDSKNLIVSYKNSFHGRTLGAQLIGGQDDLKNWIPNNLEQNLVRFVPFPDTIYADGLDFNLFTTSLLKQNISSNDISAVIIECYQGCVGSFAPKEYMISLSNWCKDNNVLLIIDEIQSGFGRTGKFWAYQHYDIYPDMILSGKGISSSLPMSAVIGRAEIMDICESNLGTTHSGNTLSCVAAKANLKFIEETGLINKVSILGTLFLNILNSISDEFPDKVRGVYGRGLMIAMHIGSKSSKFGNAEMAQIFLNKCIESGLMLYAPCGPDHANIKLVPPLTINEDDLIKGCQIIRNILSKI